MVKHFERRTQQNQAGGIIEREGALPLAKLAPVCPKCQKPARVGWTRSPSAGKQRICRTCKSSL
jgi:large subunit ribosomal protein L24